MSRNTVTDQKPLVKQICGEGGGKILTAAPRIDGDFEILSDVTRKNNNLSY